jgi:hypothetical protein
MFNVFRYSATFKLILKDQLLLIQDFITETKLIVCQRNLFKNIELVGKI